MLLEVGLGLRKAVLQGYPGKMPSVSDLLAEAEASLDRFDLEACYNQCKDILSQDPNHLDALQLNASVLIEMGQVAEARKVLQKAVALSPNAGFEKYLALAQLSDGNEALGYYSEAARILKVALPGLSSAGPEELAQIRRQYSNILCSAAELYLTDLCFEEGAEGQCEALVTESTQADGENPEGHRILADLRLVQEKKEEAKEAIVNCLELWKDQSVDDLLFPLYDQRIAMAKVLVEVDLFDEAVFVLGGLLEEDDGVIDTWYLLGIAQLSLKDTEGAIEAFVSVLALMVSMPAEEVDEEQKASVFKFLEEIGVDASKIWIDLEAELKEQKNATA